MTGRQEMKKKEITPEQIITMLREAEVLLSQGSAAVELVRKFGITEQTCNRWRREYNTIRPHSSLGYKPPAPEAVMPNTGYTHMARVLTLRVVQ
jgi:transposase-like protein